MLLSPSAPSPAALQPRRAEAAPTGPAQPRDWLKRLATYREPQLGRGLVELAVTLVPYLGLWLLAWLSLGHGYWLSLLLAVPAAGFLVRLFMIQHDCGHGSFFPRRRGNDWLGRVLGVLTLTPYGYWRRTHAVHHATSGNLDQRGMGDITTLTVREFQSLTPARRALYRLSRNPLVLLGLGPLYLFVLKHRLPIGLMRSGKDAWLSVMGTNLAIAATVAALVAVLGPGDFLLVQAPITLLASSLGIWLFYVQHQFEHTYWEPDEQWSVHAGAMQGSSHYDLPPVLRWFTANIGIHHVHHLCSRIPSYRLGEVMRAYPELRGVNRLTLMQSLRCFRFALWDEERRTMVGFREAEATAAASV